MHAGRACSYKHAALVMIASCYTGIGQLALRGTQSAASRGLVLLCARNRPQSLQLQLRQLDTVRHARNMSATRTPDAYLRMERKYRAELGNHGQYVADVQRGRPCVCRTLGHYCDLALCHRSWWISSIMICRRV